MKINVYTKIIATPQHILISNTKNPKCCFPSIFARLKAWNTTRKKLKQQRLEKKLFKIQFSNWLLSKKQLTVSQSHIPFILELVSDTYKSDCLTIHTYFKQASHLQFSDASLQKHILKSIEDAIVYNLSTGGLKHERGVLLQMAYGSRDFPFLPREKFKTWVKQGFFGDEFDIQTGAKQTLHGSYSHLETKPSLPSRY